MNLPKISSAAIFLVGSIVSANVFADALPTRTNAVVECGVVTMGMGYFSKNVGQAEQGDLLLKMGLAWAKTAIAIGQIEGVSRAAVLAETKRLSDAAGSNQASFLATGLAKMDTCSKLLKSDDQILSIWQQNTLGQ